MYKKMTEEEAELLKTPKGRSKLILKYRTEREGPTLTTDPAKLRVNVYYDSLVVMRLNTNNEIIYTWYNEDGLIEKEICDGRKNLY